MKTKPCPKCQTNVGVEFFPKNSSKKDGLGSICLSCQRVCTREHYRKNKRQYLAKQVNRRNEARDFTRALKEKTPCADCGELYPNEPWLKDFDHIGKKRFVVSRSYGWGVEAIKEEIANCEIVCLICHRRRTAKRAGWKSQPLSHSSMDRTSHS